MAVAVASASSASNGSGPTLVITKPTGLAVGDLMFAYTNCGGSAGLTLPSGWTELLNNSTGDYVVSYKIADSGDVAASDFTFTTANNVTHTGGIIRVTGAKSSSIFTSSTVSTASNTSTQSFTNGITPVANSLICMCIAYNDVSNINFLTTFSITTNDPGGWAESVNLNSVNERGVGIITAVRSQATATGAYLSQTNGDSTNSFVAFIVGIAPLVTNIKTFNTITQANTKTVNTIAIASVKSVNTIT